MTNWRSGGQDKLPNHYDRSHGLAFILDTKDHYVPKHEVADILSWPPLLKVKFDDLKVTHLLWVIINKTQFSTADRQIGFEMHQYDKSACFMVADLPPAGKNRQVGRELVEVAKEYDKEVTVNNKATPTVRHKEQRVWHEIKTVSMNLRKMIGSRKTGEPYQPLSSRSKLPGKYSRLSVPSRQVERFSSALEEEESSPEREVAPVPLPLTDSIGPLTKAVQLKVVSSKVFTLSHNLKSCLTLHNLSPVMLYHLAQPHAVILHPVGASAMLET